jgi:4-amino-4-deoxy-L-arabinose transferase-like glycosyltransferase
MSATLSTKIDTSGQLKRPAHQFDMDVVAIVGVALLFAALLGVWHCFNHALPAPDDSSYILASFKYADLMHHPKFWRPDWWHSMLTVNQAYPPAAMIFNGMLRLCFGFGNWVNILSVMIFSMLLTLSTYGATNCLTHSKRAGLMAAILVNLYPQTPCMSHLFALDLPLLTMISCGLFALFWWRDKPSMIRTIACGAIVGLACLTKQIAATYLIAPAAYCFIEAVLSDLKSRRLHLTLQLLLVAALSAAILAPWWLTNLEFIRHWANDNQTTMGHLQVQQVFPERMYWYLCSLPSIMSPLLLACFCISLLLLNGTRHRALFPMALSAFGGVTMISTLTWAFPSLRYDAPALIATAAYTGTAAAMLYENRLKGLAVSIVIALAAVQFVSFNFAPWPLPSAWARVSEVLGVRLEETFGLTQRDHRVSVVYHGTPSPAQDWGHEWCIKTIDSVQGHVPVFLNILPDLGTLNGNTFELESRTLGSLVRPTTSRRWTVTGDDVKFDPTVALYYQWYLLKTGDQGNLLRDDESERNYKKLIEFVQHGGNFKLIGTHRISDGSSLLLYQQQAR